MNLTIAASLIASIAGFTLAWQLQAGNITQLELDHANERITQQRAARQAIERTTSAVIKAQNDAAGRAVVLRRDADAARTELERLRDDINVAMRSAAIGLGACTVTANTLGELFDQCTTRYSILAETSSRHVSDIKTLIDARTK